MAEAAAVLLALTAVMASLPLGWLLLRRRFGTHVAGPLWVLLLFELLAGAYALLTPPWQMPDEPQHMVHVELVRHAGVFNPANLVRSAPSASTPVAQEVQRTILRSLRATDMGRWAPALQPQLREGLIPGPSELDHPPLYYSLAAAVTAPFSGFPVLARLALLRGLGVVLAGGTLWACGMAGRLLWPGRRWREAPMAVALAIPTFAVFSGAVNDDALANLVAALLLLVLVVGVLERGPLARPLPWTGAIISLTVLGLLTKRTFVPLLPIVLVAILFRLRRHVVPLLASVIAIELVMATAFAVASHSNLDAWEGGSLAHSYRCPQGRDGRWAICLRGDANDVRQSLPYTRVAGLDGAQLRLRLWVRGSQDGSVFATSIDTDAGLVAYRSAILTRSWEQLQLAGRVPDRARSLRVEVKTIAPGAAVVDELQLTREGPPGPGAATGYALQAATTEVDRPKNQLDNGSAENATLSAPSLLPEPVQRSVNPIVSSLGAILHRPGELITSAGVIRHRAAVSMGMLWGTAGWPTPPPLLPGILRVAFISLIVVGVLGAIGSVLRQRSPVALGVLILAVLWIFVTVLLRNFPLDDSPVTSSRYLVPGLLALATVLAAGWNHFWRGSERDFRTTTRLFAVATHTLFIALVFVPFLAR